LGLDILEQASHFAVSASSKQQQMENNHTDCSSNTTDNNKLIGNVDPDDSFIVEYYLSLGAQIVQTGMGATTSSSSSSGWSSSGGTGATGSVPDTTTTRVVLLRLQRDIPATTLGVTRFFASLREQRLERRLRKCRYRLLLYTAGIGGIALLSTIFIWRFNKNVGKRRISILQRNFWLR